MKDLFIIKVTSNGETIGTMTPEQFRKALGRTRENFLPSLVEQFNKNKESANEPERVSIEINI